MLTCTTLTNAHCDCHTSEKLAPTTLTCSLTQLWLARSHNSDMLTLTTHMLALTAQICSLIQLKHVSSHHSDMLTLTSLTIWRCWEQAGIGGSGFAGWGNTGFTCNSGSGKARSTLVGLDVASLVAKPLDSLWAGKNLWIWLHSEQVGSGSSGFAGSRESEFAMSWHEASDLT